MNTRVILISGVILATLGVVATYYSQSPFYAQSNSGMGESESTHYKRRTNVPLYVYSSFGKSSRKWNSFYDRSHTEPKSDFLNICDMSHEKNHHIGKIIHVTDEDLLNVCPFVKDDKSLQYDRVLRDILLLTLVCKKGGIIIPRNTFLMESTEHLYTQAQETGTILHGGSGNNEYGCPILVSTGSCEEFSSILLKEVQERAFRGGISFGGGLPVVLNRAKALYPKIQTLSGVREMNTHELLSIGEYTGRDLVIRVPFPQASGVNTIPNKDEWVYSTSFGDLMVNPTVLRSIALYACEKNARMFIIKEDV
jgi:hypothetical protein